jgi:hyaluronoglucosaminidase
VSEMLLSSPGGRHIELFPCWPPSHPASFSQLRAKGGYLVSARWVPAVASGGSIVDVSITATVLEGDCTLLNPWGAGKAVTVRCGGTKVAVTHDDRWVSFTPVGVGVVCEVAEEASSATDALPLSALPAQLPQCAKTSEQCAGGAANMSDPIPCCRPADKCVAKYDTYAWCVQPPELAPNRSRYAVLWNSPWPSECEEHEGGAGGPIDWAAHGVAVNDEAAFNGEVVVDLYRTGLFPRLLGNGTAINGGVPQSPDFSLSLHLAALTKIIEEDVPSVGFRGVGVFDFEDWYAQWQWHGPPHLPTGDQYWNASIKLAATAGPSLKGKALVAAAKAAWLKGAQDVMIASIEHAKKMRPHGLWGYYSRILPPDYCVVAAAAAPGSTATHSSTVENPCSEANDDLSRLWDSVDAIMPSIYLAHNDTAVSTGGVDSYVGEATRLALAAGKRRKDGIVPLVIPFVCTTYGNWINSAGVNHEYTQWLDAADAVLEFARPAEWGAAGVVVWGGSIDTTTTKRCAEGRVAFDAVLAPVLKDVAAKTSACAATNCSSRGRCATLPEVACLCDPGWSGTSCQTARPVSFVKSARSLRPPPVLAHDVA